MDIAITVEGNRIKLHALHLYIVVFCRPTAGGVHCGARMYNPIAKRFVRWTFYYCGLGRFEYCKRRDRTRNLQVYAISCVEIPRPRDYVYAVPHKQAPKVREEYMRFVVSYLHVALDNALDEIQEGVRSCFECFGLEPDTIGLYLSDVDESKCCYNRCGGRYRCATEDCVFR